MRIDPNGTIGGHPALFVRKLMWRLRVGFDWDVPVVEKLAAVSPKEARALIKALDAEGLVEPNGGARGIWRVTQHGHSFGSATAARMRNYLFSTSPRAPGADPPRKSLRPSANWTT
jgi:hypothetical protein